MTNNNKWAGLSQSEKAQLISIYIKHGYNNLSAITNHYNKFDDGGDKKKELQTLVNNINNRSNADFVNRLKDNNRQTIRDWQDSTKIATHKLSWATDDKGNAIVYPEVQNINGQLHDFTDPKYNHKQWDSLDSAIERGDTLMISPSQAKLFTENYKQYYDGFNKYDNGGDKIDNEGGYSDDTLEKRIDALKSYDPVGGFDVVNKLISLKKGNRARGEENEYYRAYLGFENDIPRTNVRLKGLDADDNRESEGEYYGTTDTMDKNIQVYADTARIKYMIDNYDLYKEELNLSKKQLERIYEQGVNMMEHPNEFVQMDADIAPGIEYGKYYRSTKEKNPLGMLAKFGARWNPEEKVIEVHDAYDFPWWVTTFSKIPKRPKVMRIRGRINYDPNKGSVLLRDKIKLDNK